MNPTELEANRKATLAFILADPIRIRLTPHLAEKTAGGGKRMIDQPARELQVFRMIPLSDVQPTVQTPDGVQVMPNFVLLGLHDSVMERWDTFTFGDHRYQLVSSIRPEHTEERYMKKADVARL